MSRRGLVSKNFGPQGGGSAAGAALMPKGEKPSAGNLMTVEQIATALRVQPKQVNDWIQRGVLRGSSAGVKPYDFEKFKLDSGEEISKGQSKALKDGQKTVDKKPDKSGGILSKFSTLFGRGKGTDAEGDAGLAKENRHLKKELSKLRSDSKGHANAQELEEKVRYLESQLANAKALETELSDLKHKAGHIGTSATTDSTSAELEAQIEKYHQEMARTQALTLQSERLQADLKKVQSERDELREQLHQSPDDQLARAADSRELQRLQNAADAAEKRLEELLLESREQRTHLQEEIANRESTIDDLRARLGEAVESRESVSQEALSDPLVPELLALQKTNLQRFARLHGLYQDAKERLAQSQTMTDRSSESDPSVAQLQAEFDSLRSKHQTLLEAQESNDSESGQFAEQLAATRASETRLKQENTQLKQQLSENDLEPWKLKVEALQLRLEESRAGDSGMEQVAAELRSARKNLQSRELQVQKLAGRLQENERALKKALKESTRLTELLIERENRLRDLSTEYEQEYRDKIDNLDRQVSDLQWKLSLREERIAGLESEISDLRKSSSR